MSEPARPWVGTGAGSPAPFSGGGRSRAEAVFTVVVWGAALAVALVFGWILFDLLRGGFGILSWEFLTAEPEDAGRAGGIGPMIVSTMLILAVCLAVAVPLGLGAAAFLSEFVGRRGWFGGLVRRSLDVLAGVPSIVFGLFGNAFFVIYLGMGFSILSGGFTLACMILPILTRSTEVGLRAVPQEYRQGAAALGMTRTHTFFHLLLPAAVPGLVVGIVLGVGRAAAETAALIFTSGYVSRMPESLSDSGRALSVHIFDLSMNISGANRQAYASALVLVALILAVNLGASMAADRWLRRGMKT